MTMRLRQLGKTLFVQGGCAALAVLLLTLAAPAPAHAQSAPDPNPGAITFTGGVDFPSLYFFRGLRQESDAKVTLWPYGDLGIALASGEGAVKSVGVNVGVWNSLHTGSSGSSGITGHAHYEEDFYATLGLGFGGGVTLGTTYMALTSPNNMFNTVKELQFKVSKAHMLNPYGFLAFELTDDGQADAGAKKGTYLELGVGPAWPIGGGKATLTVPVKFGFSLANYYEMNGDDHKFGFFDIGGLVTLPISKIDSKFGSWNIHGGLDVLMFGDTPESLNNGDSAALVGLIGIGLSY